MKGLMERVPVFVRAVFIGLAIAFIGTGAWGWLISLNLAHGSLFPWSVPFMVIVLVLWWRYFARGRGAPSSTEEARRLGGRANRVPESLWAPALSTGILGLIAVLLLQGVLGRLVSLPQE